MIEVHFFQVECLTTNLKQVLEMELEEELEQGERVGVQVQLNY
jgi:hypothetical protein